MDPVLITLSQPGLSVQMAVAYMCRLPTSMHKLGDLSPSFTCGIYSHYTFNNHYLFQMVGQFGQLYMST